MIESFTLSLLKFMLPTQSTTAIVLDGTGLIILCTLVFAYYIYKNKLEMFNPNDIKTNFIAATTAESKVINNNDPIQNNNIESINQKEQNSNNISNTEEDENEYIDDEQIFLKY